MKEYLDRAQPVSISESRRNKGSDKSNRSETDSFRSLAGTLLYLGQAVLPQASLIASKMQQRSGSLYVSDALEANVMVREVLWLKPTILFSKASDTKHITILAFSDASHAGLTEVNGQSGVFTGLKIDTPKRSDVLPDYLDVK